MLENLLAFCSFIFYKVTKFIIGNLFTLYLSISKKQAKQWRILSEKVIKSPLSLPVLMTKGPRWNTHAIIGTLGPFSVQETITVDIATIEASSRSWVLVVYRFPDYATITSLDSLTFKATSPQYDLSLKTGKYSLGLRYYDYGWNGQVNHSIIMPSIAVDGVPYVEKTPVEANVNDYYKTLIQYNNSFYFALHYYIFTLLKNKHQLPAEFIKSEFLPVGAPDTEFVFNYLNKGQALQIEVAENILHCFKVYFTQYVRSSLPIHSQEITETHTLIPAINDNGYYLFRIRRKPNALLNYNNISPVFSQEDSPQQTVTIEQSL